MIGITSFGAHIPFLRLSAGAFRKGARGEKGFANFDEDSVTMAVAAGLDCLKGVERSAVDGLFFASTTPPYSEKQAATIIAMATDLKSDLLTADFANTTKSGTSALRSAADAVGAGTAKQVLVTTADTRLGPPGSPFEQGLGDGAAALLIGKENVIASLEASHSVCREIMDVWRLEGTQFVNSWEARFTGDEGYIVAMGDAVSGVLKKAALEPKDITKAVFYTPDMKGSLKLAGKLGFDPKGQLQDSMFGAIGNTGSAYAIMMLVAALEDSKPGDSLLLANYGNGADAFVFKVTDQITKIVPRGGIKNSLASKQVVDDYRTYLQYRRLLPEAPPIYPTPLGATSAPAMYRETDKNLRFYGVRCDDCGSEQYPPQRVCAKCHSKDKFQAIRFSDKKGKLFTFSLDSVSSGIDFPSVITVIDFEGGGRMECYMTDRVLEDVKIGMDLEMTFRRLFEREGIINYFWKAMPVRF